MHVIINVWYISLFQLEASTNHQNHRHPSITQVTRPIAPSFMSLPSLFSPFSGSVPWLPSIAMSIPNHHSTSYAPNISSASRNTSSKPV
jgi:hypothetical protein